MAGVRRGDENVWVSEWMSFWSITVVDVWCSHSPDDFKDQSTPDLHFKSIVAGIDPRGSCLSDQP